MDVLRNYIKKRVPGTTLVETIVSTVIILVAFLLFSVVWADVLNSSTVATKTRLLYSRMPPTPQNMIENCKGCNLQREHIDGKTVYKLMSNDKTVMTWIRMEEANVIDSLFNL